MTEPIVQETLTELQAIRVRNVRRLRDFVADHPNLGDEARRDLLDLADQFDGLLDMALDAELDAKAGEA